MLPKLSEGHHRSIETALWMLDEMLCLFERWITRHEIHSTLYQEINTLTDKQCRLISEEIKTIRKILAPLRDDLKLKQHCEHVSQAIQAMSTLFVCDNLVPLKGSGLSVYGKIPPELNTYLDPKVDELIKHLDTIAEIGHEALKNSEEEK